jgi:hypothetical protein
MKKWSNRMQGPGERFLIKLWESLADKGIGSLLKPWQIKREGKAHAEVRRAEVLALAQAESDAAEIRSGRKNIQDFQSILKLSPELKSLCKIEDRIEPVICIESAVSESVRQSVNDAVRKNICVAKAIVYAEDVLEKSSGTPPEDTINDDWIFRWRDYVGDISSDSLQQLWGQILAGEVKAPGTFSLRCLEFVRNLSLEEAQLISMLSPLVIGSKIIWRDAEVLQTKGITFSMLMELQELGVLSGVEALELKYTWNNLDPSKSKFISLISMEDKAVVVEHSDPNKVFSTSIYMLTNLGKQIMKLGLKNPDYEYFRAFGMHVKGQGFDVVLADCEELPESKVRYFNEDKL